MTPGLCYWKLQVFEAACGPTASAAMKIPHHGTCKHDSFVNTEQKHLVALSVSVPQYDSSIVEGYIANIVLFDLMCT